MVGHAGIAFVMYLKELSLVDFKNYESAELTLSEGINCFVGDNGAGKTNLLDAVHYLSFCRSFFNPVDVQNIRADRPFFVIEGSFEKDGETDLIHCGVKRERKKQFRRNKKEYERLAEHIGRYPVVMVSPSDHDLIAGGSERRRRFMDSIISQYDKAYLGDLIAYNKALNQRNALLKKFAEAGHFDAASLEVWNIQLAEHGARIHERRKAFVEQLTPLFQEFFEALSGGREEVTLVHDSQLYQKEPNALLQESLEKDRAVKHTTTGIHKDDLALRIGDKPIKKFGSQGQQKSYLLALKLAQFQFIRDALGQCPILMLDDIFDKLDRERTEALLALVGDQRFGQVLLTDTHRERVEEAGRSLGKELCSFFIDAGKLRSWTEKTTTSAP